ncbi:hypothetical protein BDY19DRAFT_1053457 [Irpex rosettiformis]|uniref:Uncharacterized protein n=1 Tax=Irpex rosettiformis TaxID=378272 RepID=A0ACB8UIF7_9APHY|nr:hypothetical protein BDY19DRAFT_1053457 [Irpex rosettiformis]
MPKTSTSTHRDLNSFNGVNKNIQNLKRNQACHQCRRRKLVSDAKRPCSTCMRSHAYALAHASQNDRLDIPEHPECTFDDVNVVPPPQPVPAAPKTRYERLENRINELETLLRERTGPSSDSPSSGNDRSSPHPSNVVDSDFGTLPVPVHSPSLSGSFEEAQWSKAYFPPIHAVRDHSTDTTGLTGFSGPLDQLADVASLMQSTTPTDQGSNSTPSSSHSYSVGPPSAHGDIGFRTTSTTTSNEDQVTSMLYMSWPPNLPDITTTRHLVQAFFMHYMHARRMFHIPSFLASLDLHPANPKFPCNALLHIICAIGSLYASPTLCSSDSNEHQYDSFAGTRRFGRKRAKTFADQQVIFAKEEVEDGLAAGTNLFESSQTLMLLTWYYQAHARWIEACSCSAMAIRTTLPCALNVCPPFHGISSTGPFSDKPQTILPSARNVLEDETRRNSFWVAYSIERQLGAGNSWAMLLDDRDVAQLLPLREDQFEQALLVHPLDRQWSHAKDTLVTHPPDQTDSFILHVKCSMLFSKVKNFNIRFKSLAYAGDPSYALTAVGNDNPPKAPPKTTAAFISLDNLIAEFKTRFPPRFRNPVIDGKLNHYLYSACNLLHITQIHLHEPYSRPNSSSCSSALKILNSSRGIVDLLHAISSSSFDVSMLDIYPFLAWFMAGRVLVRFLKAAMDAQAEDKVICLKTEITFLHTNLVQAGTRIPLAATYAKMLNDMFMSTCNEEESAVDRRNLSYLDSFGDVAQFQESQFLAQDPQHLTSEDMMMLADYPISHVLLPE